VSKGEGGREEERHLRPKEGGEHESEILGRGEGGLIICGIEERGESPKSKIETRNHLCKGSRGKKIAHVSW